MQPQELQTSYFEPDTKDEAAQALDLDLTLSNLEARYFGVMALRIRTMTGESEPSRTSICNQGYRAL